MVSFASERLSKLHEEFSSRIKKSTQSTTYRDESNSALQSSPGVSGVSSQVFPVPSLASQGSGNQSESALSTLIVDEGGQSGNWLNKAGFPVNGIFRAVRISDSKRSLSRNILFNFKVILKLVNVIIYARSENVHGLEIRLHGVTRILLIFEKLYLV